VIDWSRVAEPSFYSNRRIQEYAQCRWPGLRTGHFDVEILGRELSEAYGPAEIPTVNPVLDCLDAWPEGEQAVFGAAGCFWPVARADGKPGGLGCMCGHDEPSAARPYATIYASTWDPVGGAEGLVHEAGHLRLKALGVQLETHDGLLLSNSPTELFESPIRKDKLRPMSAVLQAQYSYVMVTALDVALADAAHAAINLPRILEGRETLRHSARWTAEGSEFARGLYDWTTRVVDAALKITVDNRAVRA
jgi:hypothetical protein